MRKIITLEQRSRDQQPKLISKKCCEVSSKQSICKTSIQKAYTNLHYSTSLQTHHNSNNFKD